MDCSLAFEKDANGVPYAVEAKPINSPSITIKFYEGAKVSFFNPNRPNYDPIEELDSPKEINIEANVLATASFYPYGVPENHPIMLQQAIMSLPRSALFKPASISFNALS